MWRKTKKGFTLIELMVVISIIVILVSMLYPTVISAIATARAQQVQVRMNDLVTGCTNYYSANGYYPGQSASNTVELSRASTTGTTGSQLLAECLFLDFTDPAWDNGTGTTNLTNSGAGSWNRSLWHWKSNYATVNYGLVSTGVTTDRSDLMTSAPSDPAVGSSTKNGGNTIPAKPYCIADRFSTCFLPILYFPAHMTDTGGNPLTGLQQFIEADNINYYNFVGTQVFNTATNYGWQASNGVNSQLLTTTNGFICDTRYGSTTTPYHSGEYLLIAAGRDRMYGSQYTIKNWSN